MAAMLRKPEARRHLVRAARRAHRRRANQFGVALDFEQVPKKSQRDFVAFIGDLAAGCTART